MKRRSFLQKSLLTAGALGLVPAGLSFAGNPGNPGSAGTLGSPGAAGYPGNSLHGNSGDMVSPGAAGNPGTPEPTEPFRPHAAPPAEGPLDQSLPLRYRQIHLDFHTSGHIPDIGIDFDPEEFASTLKKAHVNSVTCFGRCHHGYIYHETDLFSERLHPHTKRPHLLREQIEACHRQNIRVPIYVTIQWDEFTAREHPEWLMRDHEGKPFGNTTFQAGFYRRLCVYTPYRDFLKAYLAELFEKVPVDGLFLDIVGVFPNANEACLKGMRDRGLDASLTAVRRAFYQEVMDDFKGEMTAFIRKLDRECTIFYNGGHIGPDIRGSAARYTHLELESLPSGGWGYLHFPLTSRYARTLGHELLGMTGKFHTSWGDFHSLKNKAALEFECFSMLAMNAKCSVGDQLHPRGRLDEATYDLIGDVFSQVAKKEAWCEKDRAVTDIAVFSAEEFTDPDSPDYARIPQQMMGAIRMLQEGQHQFDVIDSKCNLDGYKLLIMPDRIPVDPQLSSKIESYLYNGGSLIASFRSGLSPEGDRFSSSYFGLELMGEAPFSPDFLALDGKGLGTGLPVTELVMYMRGMEVEATGAEILVHANVPYFNRTWEHYSSHRHTPSEGRRGYPAITQNGRVIYFMHPIFTQYAHSAPRWCRTIFLNAVDLLLPSPVLKMNNAPGSLVATVNEQPEKNRYVVHLLHYVPERRGTAFDVLEDVLPVFNLEIDLAVPRRVSRVSAVPQGRAISFRQRNGRVIFTLPELLGHQMIEVGF